MAQVVGLGIEHGRIGLEQFGRAREIDPGGHLELIDRERGIAGAKTRADSGEGDLPARSSRAGLELDEQLLTRVPRRASLRFRRGASDKQNRRGGESYGRGSHRDDSETVRVHMFYVRGIA